jgi:long-chain fatty acid transport protein
VVVGVSRDAAAQGFGIYEHHACTMATAGAGVADPCADGSAVFFNPAALADIKGSVFTIGGTMIGPFGTFTPFAGGAETDLTKQWITVPNFYYARDLGSRAKFGFGLMAPYGLEIGWPGDFIGRFSAYDAKLQAVYLQPTVAFKVNEQVMVGGGVDITLSKVELRQRADLYSVPITGTPFTFGQLGVPRYTDFADILLEGDTVTAGFHLGLLVKANEQFSFGARYLSRQTVETDEGDFNTEQIPTGLRTPIPLGPIPAGFPIDTLLFVEGARLADQAVGTSLPLPDQMVLGVMFKATDAMKVKIDYQWVNWSLFDELLIEAENGLSERNVENYKDTHGFRFGTEFAMSDKTFLRGGFLTHTGAAPDETVTPLLPEGPRWEFTVGLGSTSPISTCTSRIGTAAPPIAVSKRRRRPATTASTPSARTCCR